MHVPGWQLPLELPPLLAHAFTVRQVPVAAQYAYGYLQVGTQACADAFQVVPCAHVTHEDPFQFDPLGH